MTRRDKIGLGVVVGLLALLALGLWFTWERPAGPARDFDESVLVERRIDILGRNQ